MSSKRRKFTPDEKARIVLEILKEEKSVAQLSSEHGIHTNVLNRWKAEAIQNLPQLFVDDRKGITKMKNDYENQINELYAEVGKLSTQLAWLKKNLASEMPREQRVELLEWQESEFPITVQAELLSLNRSSLYYKPIPPSPEELRLKHRIDEIYTEHPFLGYRRIATIMNREGDRIHENTVRTYMREMGIMAIYPGPNLSKRNLEHRVYPYLLKGLQITKPNQVWGVDITYIRMKRGWMYLFAIIDWYSRYVVDWQLDQSLEIGFVLESMKRALNSHIPEIINSDQGSHFTSSQYIDLLKENKVRISMDGKRRAVDNIIIERFWRSLKYNEVYLNDYTSPRETRAGVARYIHLHNHYLPHQSLQDQTPESVYNRMVSTSRNV
ncbi:IS3 family transposase [Paenibacillus sp. WST5]|uniref:IS3 family transposase n=1 Tax=Paenibacillus sedimenti TaxID=2770274 RepID=A0A926QP10_9BACL|nr:IS3 family transposase [Paenibacillus sedimenti]